MRFFGPPERGSSPGGGPGRGWNFPWRWGDFKSGFEHQFISIEFFGMLRLVRTDFTPPPLSLERARAMDAVALVTEAHGAALCILVGHCGRHFERFASPPGTTPNLELAMRRDLALHDGACQIVRHITRPSVDSFVRDLEGSLGVSFNGTVSSRDLPRDAAVSDFFQGGAVLSSGCAICSTVLLARVSPQEGCVMEATPVMFISWCKAFSRGPALFPSCSHRRQSRILITAASASCLWSPLCMLVLLSSKVVMEAIPVMLSGVFFFRRPELLWHRQHQLQSRNLSTSASAWCL
jgi:hypothetical protein